MRRNAAKTVNQPFVEFEDFKWRGDTLTSETVRLCGRLSDIRAHTKLVDLVVEYEQFLDIVILSQKSNREEHNAVSYAVRFRLVDGHNATIPIPAGREAVTHVRFWNFSSTDLLRLAFLRHDRDRKLFIACCDDTGLLLDIASARLADTPKLATAAYARALALVAPQAFGGDHMRGFLKYLDVYSRTANSSDFALRISEFCERDVYGLGGPELARIMDSVRCAPHAIGKVLSESCDRLVRTKPKGAAAALTNALDRICALNLTKPARDYVLWQAYLAAAAERETDVLRRLWVRARKLKADRETLELIHRTWRGFATPQRNLPGAGILRALGRIP